MNSRLMCVRIGMELELGVINTDHDFLTIILRDI